MRMLFTGEPHRDGPVDKWKFDTSTVRETNRFVLETGQLDYGAERRNRKEAAEEDESETSNGQKI